MLDDNTGISASSLRRHYTELLIELATLSQEGFTDLATSTWIPRGGGSRLSDAQFLPKNKLIVYNRAQIPGARTIVKRRSRQLSEDTAQWFLSTKVRHRHPRFSQEPCKTMTAPPSSAAVRSARVWCSNRSYSRRQYDPSDDCALHTFGQMYPETVYYG